MSLITSDKLSREERQKSFHMSVVNLTAHKFVDIEVSPSVALKYAGDFYGLLTELDIHRTEFPTTLLANGLLTSDAYTGEKSTIRTITYD